MVYWVREGKRWKFLKNFHRQGTHPWFNSFKLKRRSIVSINRLRSGHTSLRDSLKKINIIESDTCDCGNVRETANHVLWQCCRFDSPRELLIRDLIKQKIFPPYCIKMFLHNMDQSFIPIVRFINSIVYFKKKKKMEDNVIHHNSLLFKLISPGNLRMVLITV
jgi:hypothetical protein